MEALNQAAPGGCSSGTLWRTPAAPAQRPMPEQRQSGPGIGSFVVSATCAVLMFLLLVVAGMLELSTPGGLDEESAEAMLIGMFMFLLMGGLLVGLGLGIGGLLQRERRKTFAILGTVLAAGTLLLTIGILLLGMMLA